MSTPEGVSLQFLCRSASPSETKDGRHGLFGTLQGTEAGSPNLDSWMGHPLVNPNKGKLGLTAPTDAKGAYSYPPPINATFVAIYPITYSRLTCERYPCAYCCTLLGVNQPDTA